MIPQKNRDVLEKVQKSSKWWEPFPYSDVFKKIWENWISCECIWKIINGWIY